MDGLVVERFFDVKSQNVGSKYNLKSIDNDMVNLSQPVYKFGKRINNNKLMSLENNVPYFLAVLIFCVEKTNNFFGNCSKNISLKFFTDRI